MNSLEIVFGNIAAVAYDLLCRAPLSDVSIHSTVIVIWCFVLIVNLLFIGNRAIKNMKMKNHEVPDYGMNSKLIHL